MDQHQLNTESHTLDPSKDLAGIRRLREAFEPVAQQEEVDQILTRAAEVLPQEFATNVQLQERRGVAVDRAEALVLARDDALHKAMALNPNNPLAAWMKQGDDYEQDLRKGTVSMAIMERSQQQQERPQKLSANDLTGDALLIGRQPELPAQVPNLQLSSGSQDISAETVKPKRTARRFLTGAMKKGVEKLKGAVENPRTRMAASIAIFALGVAGYALNLKYGYTGAEQLHESLTTPDTISNSHTPIDIPDITPMAPELPLPEPEIPQVNPLSHLSPEQIAAFNVPDLGTGEGIMRNLGVDPQQWYTISSDLAEKFPNEFYVEELPSGAKDVRLAHSGQLSVEALQTISSRLGLWK